MSTEVINFAAGSLAGAVGAFGVLPIDITKTKVQQSSGAVSPSSIIRNIYISDHIKGFYRGGTTQVLFVAPEKVIKFTVNRLVLEYLPNQQIFAGMCAGFCQVVVTNPMEILKIQMQINKNKGFSIFQAYRQIGGAKSLYRGASLCFMRDVPFSGIYFPMYSYLNSTQGWNMYYSSLLSGAVAAYCCTPMDVVKTRVQANLNAEIIPTFTNLVKTEGVIALFKGGEWRALKSGPQFMITQVVFNLFSAAVNPPRA